MGEHRGDDGFTIVEMIVTLVVMSLFLTMFFQVYSTNESQRLAVARRAAAYDIATSNLSKISSKAGFYAVPYACDSSASGNKNNLQIKPALVDGGGSTIATNSPGGSPTWAAAAATPGATDGIAPESITDTVLPAGTTQELKVLYPQGCFPDKPITIVSIVSYGSGSESVQRAAFVN